VLGDWKVLFRFPAGKRDVFCSAKHPDAVWSQTTPLLNGHRVLCSQGKEAGREIDPSPRPIEEIKNECRAQEQVYLYVTVVIL